MAWILIQKPLAKPKSIIECQDVSMFVKNYVVVWFKDNYAKSSSKRENIEQALVLCTFLLLTINNNPKRI